MALAPSWLEPEPSHVGAKAKPEPAIMEAQCGKPSTATAVASELAQASSETSDLGHIPGLIAVM